MYFKRIAGLCLMILGMSLPTPGRAQDIAADLSGLSVGDFFVYRSSQGTDYTQIYVGQQEGLFVFDVFEGTDATGTRLGAFHTDANGQNVLRVGANGATERFEPHDCRRTVGECRTTYTNAAGTQYAAISLIEATNRGFTMEAFDAQGQLYQTRTYVLGDNGLPKRITIRRPGEPTERVWLVDRGPS